MYNYDSLKFDLENPDDHPQNYHKFSDKILTTSSQFHVSSNLCKSDIKWPMMTSKLTVQSNLSQENDQKA